MKSAGPCDELGRVWPVDPPAIRYPQGVWRGRCLLIFFYLWHPIEGKGTPVVSAMGCLVLMGYSPACDENHLNQASRSGLHQRHSRAGCIHNLFLVFGDLPDVHLYPHKIL